MTIFNSVTAARCVIVGALLAAVVALAATRSPMSQPGDATTSEAEASHPRIASSTEQDFLEANASAMATMMRGMHFQPTGDIDRDFVQQMIILGHGFASWSTPAEARTSLNDAGMVVDLLSLLPEHIVSFNCWR